MKKIAKTVALVLIVLIIIYDISLFILAREGCWSCFIQAGIIGMPWSIIFFYVFRDFIDFLGELILSSPLYIDSYLIEDIFSYTFLFLSQAINITIIYFIILWIGKIRNK